MAPQINSSLFSYIFNRANSFSFTGFLSKIFTSPDSVRCCLSNQRCYFEFNFYQKYLKPPLSNSSYIMSMHTLLKPLHCRQSRYNSTFSCLFTNINLNYQTIDIYMHMSKSYEDWLPKLAQQNQVHVIVNRS